MKASELINKINAIMQEHGDLETKERRNLQLSADANVEFMRIPKDKRQAVYAVYTEGVDKPEQKGEKVLVI